MTIISLTNSISPNTVERATADADPFDRNHINAFAHNFDDHDHALGKNLGVKRLQTTVAPAASGEVRVNGDTLQWWGASAGAVQSALTTTQTITGATLGDPIVRDAILFGEQGTALAPDVTLTRTAAGALTVATAPSGGTPLTTRMALAQTGTLTLTPDAGVAALVWAAGKGILQSTGANPQIVANSPQNLELYAGGGVVAPSVDGALTFGASTLRWLSLWATTGTIQTSSGDSKENIRDFNADDALDALRVLRLRRFDYRAPVGREVPESEAEAQVRKNIIGFVSEEAPALLTLGDGRSVSPQQTAVLGLAAVKALLARLDAHEVRLDALEAGD